MALAAMFSKPSMPGTTPGSPTYIAIIMRKDGTAKTKCLNPPSTRRRSSSASLPPASFPFKKRLVTPSFLPKWRALLDSTHYSTTCTPHTVLPCYITSLPSELVTCILLQLDCDTLSQLARTCRQLYQACHDNHLWQNLFERDFHCLDQRRTLDFNRLYHNHRMLTHRWQKGLVKTQYLRGHEDSVYCLAFVGDHHLVSGSRDKSIRRWDLRTGLCDLEAEPLHEGSVLCMRTSFDQSMLITGSSDTTCRIWSLPNLTPLATLRGHHYGVLDVCFLHDRNRPTRIVSASRDHTLRVWDLDGNELYQLVGHTGPVNALDPFGKDKHMVVSASGDATIKLWNIDTGECVRTFCGPRLRGLACVRSDGERVYSGGLDGLIHIWDPATGECLTTLPGHVGLIRTMDCTEGKLISGGYDRTIRVWDPKTATCLLSYQSGHSSWIFNVLTNRARVVSAGQDKRIMVLDFGQGLAPLDT